MPETLEQSADENRSRLSFAMQIELLQIYSREILLSTALIVGGVVPLQIALYMTTYAMTVLKTPSWVGMITTIVVGASLFVFTLIGGWLSDRLGRKLLATIPRVILALLIYPAFVLLIEAKSLVALLGTTALLVGLLSLSGAAMGCLMMEALPQRVRALGYSIAYGLGIAVFGGMTQFATNLLIRWTGNEAAPAFLIIVCSIITLLAIAALPDSRGKHLG
jgi:MFS family permease